MFPFHHRSPVLTLILSRNACHTIQCLLAFQVSRLHAVRTTVATTKHFTEVKRLLHVVLITSELHVAHIVT